LILSKAKKDIETQKEEIQCDSITVNDWFTVWFETYKKCTLKPTGVPTYRRKFVNTLGRILGDILLKELTQLDIQNGISQLVNEKYAFKTIRDAVSILKLCYDSAIGNKMLNTNPCLGVIVPDYSDVKEERRVLTNREQKIILDYVQGTFYEELYKFLLLTGVRIGEVGGLQWQDIDFDNGFVCINRSLSCQYENGIKTSVLTSPKTKNSFRKIPFFGETKEILLSQKQKTTELKRRLGTRFRMDESLGDLVFCTTMGSPITRYSLASDMNHMLDNINKTEIYNASIEGRKPVLLDHIHPHCFRHTVATRLCEKRMPLQVVQRIMGHASINMTMSYTHINDDELSKNASNIGDFLE
jgi:Site-specific recombinase XerD